MNKITFLFWAYTAIWTGLFIFMLKIAHDLKAQQQKLKLLDERLRAQK